MIIKSLVDRYNKSPDKVAFGWSKYSVHYGICINEDGKITNIISLCTVNDKGKSKPLELTLPLKEQRTSGVKSYFLCDTAEYLLNVYSEKRLEKWRKENDKDKNYVLTEEELLPFVEATKKEYDASKALHEKLLNGVNSQSARAIKEYFKQDNPYQEWQKTNPANLPAFDNGETLVFVYDGKRIDFDDCGDDIKKAYDDSLSPEVEISEKAHGKKLCLVLGEKDEIKILHNPISLRGVNMGRQPLISMNDQKAFRSYGDDIGDPPCQIGSIAMFAYTSALNDLLKSGNNTISIGGDTLVYWVDDVDEEETLFNAIMDPKEDDGQKLDGIMNAIKAGNFAADENISYDGKFYLLCLSPNASRISVRFFYQNSFGNILNNIKNHYDNLEIHEENQNGKWKYIPYWQLLSETTVMKKASDVLPLLAGQLFRSIITGNLYPQSFFNSIIIRCRNDTENKINRTKCSFIKAVLIRNYKDKEVTTVALNKESNNIPYLLGRLFSFLEQLQENAAGEGKEKAADGGKGKAAGGGLNSTIKDRYFSSACANPASVFPILLKLSQHHLAKLENSTFFDKSIGELLDKIDSPEKPFPSALSLDDQGRFILGFYHQTQERYRKKSVDNNLLNQNSNTEENN